MTYPDNNDEEGECDDGGDDVCHDVEPDGRQEVLRHAVHVGLHDDGKVGQVIALALRHGGVAAHHPAALIRPAVNLEVPVDADGVGHVLGDDVTQINAYGMRQFNVTTLSEWGWNDSRVETPIAIWIIFSSEIQFSGLENLVKGRVREEDCLGQAFLTIGFNVVLV